MCTTALGPASHRLVRGLFRRPQLRSRKEPCGAGQRARIGKSRRQRLRHGQHLQNWALAAPPGPTSRPEVCLRREREVRGSVPGEARGRRPDLGERGELARRWRGAGRRAAESGRKERGRVEARRVRKNHSKMRNRWPWPQPRLPTSTFSRPRLDHRVGSEPAQAEQWLTRSTALAAYPTKRQGLASP
jgi:hypothetical protein